ncbi:hypothetical protein C1Y40_04588 [Mycobacterium talmoniae]|uniref:Uncharacterized protein n=1 Tax=Mycobacterium talmoniae TaxID=1858794 RepID=A0A2S8BF33_9MYCO|nr:hypothetical protein C1Y40_04588 [Mycobacterium talmoniae]
MTITDERPPVRRGPRNLTSRRCKRQTPTTPTSEPTLGEQFKQLYRQHGAPECRERRAEFDHVEKIVELVTRLGIDPSTPSIHVNGQPSPVAEPISTVLQWCADCPFQQVCYQIMTTEDPPYTGIGGGKLLHKSRVYRPRRGRIQRPSSRQRQTESGVTDGLW